MKKLILSIFVLSFVLVSCDITDMNDNEKGASNVPPDPLFTSAQFSMGDYLHNTNVNVNIFKFMAQYFTATDYPQEPQYQLDNRTIPSNIWSELYRDVLADLKEAKAKIRDDELMDAAVKQNKIATIEVMNVMAYHHMVTLWGDIPYRNGDEMGEALDPNNRQPTYMDAEKVYMDLMSRLNTAISNFDASAAAFGGADSFYNGDVAAWLKFANSLKLRMGIMLADSNPDVAKKAVEEAAPNAFTSNADNALIPFESAPPHANPVWEAVVYSGRDDYIPAKPLVDRMNNLDDPRRPVFYDKEGGEYIGGPYGVQNAYADYSHLSSVMEEPGRPGVIMGYDEVEFILAEAAARGYNVSGTAAEHYENAIRADMEYWDVAESEIASYLSQPEVAYATASGDWKEKIGNQKWLGLFLQGYQGWTVYRRLDTPNLQAPEDAADAAEGQVPVRYTYPIDEQNYNEENYNKAAESIGGDKLTTKLFWDVN